MFGRRGCESLVKIGDETELICPVCSKVATSEQWDAFSISQCLTREQRRAYKSIVHMYNRPGKKRDFYFCCPYCEKWSAVAEIKVYVEGNESCENTEKDIQYKEIIETEGFIGVNTIEKSNKDFELFCGELDDI